MDCSLLIAVAVGSKGAEIVSPNLLTTEPYSDAWLIKVRPSKAEELEKLLDAEAYTALLG